MILTALTGPPEEDPEAEGTQRYAGEIPLEGRFTDSIPLYTPGAEVGSTYDLRLGDATGRRPAGLPEAIVQDAGESSCSPRPCLTAGCSPGGPSTRRDLDFPVELVLREITETGETELHRSSAV